MKIQVVKTEPRFMIVKLIGSLDMTTVGEVEREFLALTSKCQRNVIADLAGVSFLASMGLSMFLGAKKGLERSGLRLVLTNPSPHIKEAIRASRLSKMLLIVANEEDALRYFSVPDGA